jgi:hypothetical protein
MKSGEQEDRVFVGFAAADFHSDPDLANRRAALDRFGTAVRAELSTDELSRAGGLSLVLSDDDQASTKESPADVQIMLAPDRLELRLWAMSDRAGTAFLDWLEESSSLARLRTMDRYQLVLVERRPANFEARYGAERPKWSGANQLLIRAKHSAADIDDDLRQRLLSVCATFDQRWQKFGISLQIVWEAADAISSGVDLGMEVAVQIRNLLPILGSVNLAVRRAKGSRAPALDRASWRKPG